MTIYKKIMNVQSELKAPKGNYNSFGKYSYRSAEDILEAVKPLLKKEGLVISISDNIELIGDRYYVKSTVKLIDIETGDVVETSALAREDETKKGMDLSMVTGSCSSYARKYALNGAFAIDSSELDPDKTHTFDKEVPSRNQSGDTKGEFKTLGATLSDKQVSRLIAIAKNAGQSVELVKKVAKKDYGVEELNQLSKKDYDALCDRLEKAKK